MSTTKTMASASPEDPGRSRKEKAKALGLYGLLDHWEELDGEEWIDRLLAIEEKERARRSLERRVRNAKIGRFKPLGDFDWSWPEEVDREAIEELCRFGFLEESANVILIGPNGVGKTTIAQNLAHQAVLRGHTVRFTTASGMLNELGSQETATGLARCMRRYCRPSLLVVDEVGYLSYGSRQADLLFEVVNRRQESKSTVVTTNKPFAEWNEVFPNSTSVVALIDRLIHRSELIQIRGESYRLKEAKERSESKAKARSRSRKQRGETSPRGKKT